MKRKPIVECYNCGNEMLLSPSLLQVEDFEYEETVRATYVECPVCGEKMLKQLDTIKTYSEDTPKILKLTRMQRHRKLSQKQKFKLSKLERDVRNTRKSLQDRYHHEIYQLLNQETGDANQEHTLGSGTNTVKLGKETEHV